MTEPVVLTSLEDDVLTITLNRPERLNALNPELLDAFGAAFEKVEATTRVVVVRGSGRAFSAGHDLKWSAEHADKAPMTADQLAATTDRLHEITRRIRSCTVPVVSRVHGYAIGGGAEIALSGDLVVAGSSAVFRFTETAVGLVVTNSFTAVMPRTAGPVIAKEIIMLGEPFDGEQARSWGLVNRVVADADLDGEVSRIVATLKTKSPIALRLTKNLLDRAWEGTTEEIMRRETLASVEASLGPDSKEAATAFAEGREPRFAPQSVVSEP